MSPRERAHEIISGYGTAAGRRFDIALIILILLSVTVILLESLQLPAWPYGLVLRVLEWFFTLAFTTEYILRIWSAPVPRRYIFSFYGIIDLFSILPALLGFFLPDALQFSIVRILRLLRIFRILKLVRFMQEGNVLLGALLASRFKITLFLGTVLSMVTIMGALMHAIEGPENGFTNIPRGIYWAIVTVTTVGYGDIAPQTPLGQILASLLMLMGYGIIAVPTGIVSTELGLAMRSQHKKECTKCHCSNHLAEAAFCQRCGEKL